MVDAESKPKRLSVREKTTRIVRASDEPERQRGEPGWTVDRDPAIAIRLVRTRRAGRSTREVDETRAVGGEIASPLIDAVLHPLTVLE